MRQVALALLLLAAQPACAQTPARAAGLPTKVGGCAETTLQSIGPRLEGVPDSGTHLAYANGLRQTSYDVIPAAQASRVGDKVRVCLMERPKNCPAGDDRGSKYSAENLRTGGRWTAADSQHMCGGA